MVSKKNVKNILKGDINGGAETAPPPTFDVVLKTQPY